MVFGEISFRGPADFMYFSRAVLRDVEDTVSSWKNPALMEMLRTDRMELDEKELWRFGLEKKLPPNAVEVVPTGKIDWREKDPLETLVSAAKSVLEDAKGATEGKTSGAFSVGLGLDSDAWVEEMRPSRFAKSFWNENGSSKGFFGSGSMHVEAGDELEGVGHVREESRQSPPSMTPRGQKPKLPGKWVYIGKDGVPEGASINNDGKGGGKTGNPLISVDGRGIADRLAKLHYRIGIEAEQVPQRPLGEPRLVEQCSAAVDYLKAKFSQRPVWVRRAVLIDAPAYVHRHFKLGITRVAYAFANVTGPFNAGWVRYGYDPRESASVNRKYQCLDIRMYDPVITAAMLKKYGNLEAWDASRDRGNFDISELPSKKQVNLQLCDLEHLEGLKELLLHPDNVLEEFDKVTGFLTKQGLVNVVQLIRRRVKELAVEVLGSDEVLAAVEKHELSKRRRRYSHIPTGGRGSSNMPKDAVSPEDLRSQPPEGLLEGIDIRGLLPEGENGPEAKGLQGNDSVEDDVDAMRYAAEKAVLDEAARSKEIAEAEEDVIRRLANGLDAAVEASGGAECDVEKNSNGDDTRALGPVADGQGGENFTMEDMDCFSGAVKDPLEAIRTRTRAKDGMESADFAGKEVEAFEVYGDENEDSDSVEQSDEEDVRELGKSARGADHVVDVGDNCDDGVINEFVDDGEKEVDAEDSDVVVNVDDDDDDDGDDEDDDDDDDEDDDDDDGDGDGHDNNGDEVDEDEDDDDDDDDDDDLLPGDEYN